MVGHFISSSIQNSLNYKYAKNYSPGQLLFGRDMTLPIKHKVDWELIRHKNQTKINKYNIQKK